MLKEKQEICKKSNSNNAKGITLIALIITIIVMLILVGVTVNVAINGGLFSKAREATKQTEIARIEEQILAAKVSAMKEDGTIDGNKLVEELQQIDGLEVVDYKEGDKVVTVKYVDKVQEIDLETGESVETTGGEIERVEDDVPGDITNSKKYDGSENNPYLIESIEDLVAFSEKVDSGETYEGKTIKLAYNLDFNSNNSYINPNSPYTSKEQEEEIDINENGYIESIKIELTTGKGFNDIGVIEGSILSGASPDVAFRGTFDGNGKTIYNLYINASYRGSSNSLSTSSGLFAVNQGTIRKLGITISKDSYSPNSLVGVNGDLGYLWSNPTADPSSLGSIENCYCKFNVGAQAMCGLVYMNGGSIKNCYSSGKMVALETGDNESVAKLCMLCDGSISNCYSVLDSQNKDVDVPLCFASNFAQAKYENCYNLSGIIVKELYRNQAIIRNCYAMGFKNVFYGGIVGDSDSSSKVIMENCYFNGTINVNRVDANKKVGGLIGGQYNSENVTIKDSKYLEKSIYVDGVLQEDDEYAATKEEMETYMKSVLEVINGEGAFKEDTNNINNGYPILSWQ